MRCILLALFGQFGPSLSDGSPAMECWGNRRNAAAGCVYAGVAVQAHPGDEKFGEQSMRDASLERA